ncbi:hypothetical protein AAZX31_03G203400 [Glycine max]|uniref:Uncharacterized protein n=1 Tax=Glycine soja TaxID=3848 RepID=A0A445LFK3_GLYSO|nr:hypothetical protein D0Y65_007917 [Glycine soja]
MGGHAATTYSAAKISVWWDIDNCRVPKGHNANSIAQNITSALVGINYAGPLSISAYGDTNRIPPPVQHALSSTGVSLNHIPTGANDASDMKILVDMLLWAVDNPAPANYLLISGDTNFSNALHQLSLRKYNILLAHPPHVSPSLAAAAKVVWLWTTLSAGGPPLSDSTSNSCKPPTPAPLLQPFQFKPKPKYIRKITTITPIETKNNDAEPLPPPPQPLRKFFIGAPHEFFTSKCNEPVNLIPTPTSSKEINQILIPRRDSHQKKLNEIPRVMNATTHQDNSEYNVENLIDVIMRTLNLLKVEMILPSEANITDCIRYGDPKYQTIDVRMVLDAAIQQGRLAKRVCGPMHLYLARNDTLWNCVNHMGGHPCDFPQETWDRVKQFLTSSSGRSLMLTSRCRYTYVFVSLVVLKG